MRDFYTFYKATCGALSEQAYNLFWEGRYLECYRFYNSLIAKLELGMTDRLIYQHCARATNQDDLQKIGFPAPPSPKEVLSLYHYECSQEQKALEKPIFSRKFLSQPYLLSKAILAAFLGLKFRCTNAIETGTYLGGTTYLLSGVFDRVQTLEADDLLFETSKFWLERRTSNVLCHHGDSGSLLEALIDYDEPTLFFLDAHYSTGPTTNKYGACALINELKLIFKRRNKSVVVIDDTRCFGSFGWPSFVDIFDVIPPDKSIILKNDQLIIKP